MIYNTQKLGNLGVASLCHGAGLRETAEIASSTLMDFGVVTEKVVLWLTRHGKRQQIYTSNVCSKIILPQKVHKLRQK